MAYKQKTPNPKPGTPGTGPHTPKPTVPLAIAYAETMVPAVSRQSPLTDVLPSLPQVQGYQDVHRIVEGVDIYRARHPDDGRSILIHPLNPSTTFAPGLAERLPGQADIIASNVRPRGVVTITAVEQLPSGHPVIVMEPFAGATPDSTDRSVVEAALQTIKLFQDTERMIGTDIRGFVVARLQGKGAMGAVYVAQNPDLPDQKVAIKILQPVAGMSAEILRLRFEQEARVLLKLQHHRIVRLNNYQILPNGDIAMVMELIEGKTLEAHTRDPAFLERHGIRGMLEIARQMLEGLEYAHAEGVIHRDIKPANTMVEEARDGLRTHLLDFGIARVQGDLRRSETLTGTNVMAGTLNYMAPEIIEIDKTGGARSVTFSCDLYSLGATLFEALTGQTLFERPLTDHLLTPPSRLADRGVRASPGLEEFVQRLLKKKPEERYPSARAAIEALQQLTEYTGAPVIPVLPVPSKIELSKEARREPLSIPISSSLSSVAPASYPSSPASTPLPPTLPSPLRSAPLAAPIAGISPPASRTAARSDPKWAHDTGSPYPRSSSFVPVAPPRPRSRFKRVALATAAVVALVAGTVTVSPTIRDKTAEFARAFSKGARAGWQDLRRKISTSEEQSDLPPLPATPEISVPPVPPFRSSSVPKSRSSNARPATPVISQNELPPSSTPLSTTPNPKPASTTSNPSEDFRLSPDAKRMLEQPLEEPPAPVVVVVSAVEIMPCEDFQQRLEDRTGDAVVRIVRSLSLPADRYLVFRKLIVRTDGSVAVETKLAQNSRGTETAPEEYAQPFDLPARLEQAVQKAVGTVHPDSDCEWYLDPVRTSEGEGIPE